MPAQVRVVLDVVDAGFMPAQGMREMSKGRMEAFSDGVIAVIITIMVLALAAPHGADLSDLLPLVPTFMSYVLSFVFLGIYWNNHHHLLQATRHVNGRILWANLHLLFWLSLIPFATNWMGVNNFAAWPVALYGVVQLFAGLAFYALSHSLIALHGQDSVLATALGPDIKSKVSLVMYAAAVPLAFVYAWAAFGLYVVVAIMWLIPNSRIEKALYHDAHPEATRASRGGDDFE
jgi:uncharacterized membrane protein